MPGDDRQTINDGATIKAFVDRIEANLAVILLGDDAGVQFDLPVQYLPPGIRAGDHLVISFKLDPAGAAATLHNVSELKRQLTEAGDPGQTEFKL
jgi:hypothetical protein